MTTATERRTVRQHMDGEPGAEVAAQPADEPNPGTQLVPADPLRAMLAEMESEFARQLPKFISPEAFSRAALTGLRSSKQAAQLAACRDNGTLYAALLDACRYGLMPFTDEGAIVPYRQGNGYTAVFIPMYLGLVQMFYRSGQVQSVTAKMVAKGDYWDEAYGDGGGWVHKPRRFTDDGQDIPRGTSENPWILAYCYVTLKGGGRTEVEVVSLQDAEYARSCSKAYQNAERLKKADSLWHTNFPAMWLKTAVRRQAKWAPKSAQMMDLLTRDDERDRTTTTARVVGFPAGAPAAAWDGDVGFGTVVQGTVVGSDDDPWGAQPSGEEEIPDADVVDEAPPAAQNGQEPASAAPPDDPAASRAADLAAVSKMLAKHGYEGDGNAPERLTMLRMLARPPGHDAPMQIGSPGAASPLEAGTARANLTALIRTCNRTKVPIKDALGGLVDDYIARARRPAAPPASGAPGTVDPATPDA
jgi:recombination protein RecT